jgi:hypothetical protein
MKKILLLSLIGMILFSETLVASATGAFANPGPGGFWIKITLNFHRPKMDCSSGFGICLDFSAGVDLVMPSTGTCPVQMRINDRNQLQIQVTEDNLRLYDNGSALPYFRDTAGLLLEDPYTLSTATAKELGSSTPVVIRAGRYPVTLSNGIYTVTIPL